MMSRRPYVIRPQAAQWGKEVTIPPDSKFKVGDKVIVLADGFVVVVPPDAQVDEEALKAAIKLR
jgi:hypothetical protein